MKSASAGMDAALGSTSATLVTCIKITASDGTVIGFSNYTRDFQFEGVDYDPSTGHTPTALESNSSLSVDNLDVDTIRKIDALTGPDILNGKWDFADVRLFLIDPTNLPNGELKLRRATVGRVSLGRTRITSEIRGMLEHLTKQILELYSPGCRADLGDSRCKVIMVPPIWLALTAYTLKQPFDASLGSTVAPTSENGRHFKATFAGISGGTEPIWDTTVGNTTIDGSVIWTAIEANTQTGTATSVSTANKRIFIDSTKTSAAADFFTGGLLTFTGGLNIGRSMEVKKYTNSTGQFELVLPVAFVIATSDSFSVQAGCFKRVLEDCRNRFGNTHNFRGEPDVQQNFRIAPARIDTNSGGK